MTSMYINKMFKTPETKKVHRVLFYTNSFESVPFPAVIEKSCPYCASEEERAEDAKEKEERKMKREADKEF